MGEKFSERHKFKKIKVDLKNDLTLKIRNRIWNVFYIYLFHKMHIPYGISSLKDDNLLEFVFFLVDKFYKKDISDFIQMQLDNILNEIKDSFLREGGGLRDLPFLKWYEIYDFIEFFAEHYPDKEVINSVLCKLNEIFEEEKVPYRIINRVVTPLFQKEEIEEIEKVFDLSEKYKPVMGHLEKALKFYANREKPDYENSIKESISAVESLAQIVLGKDGTLGALAKSLNIHSALREALSKLYGWTSDEEGIRHAKTKEPLSAGPEEARFMLVTASAFVNYVVEKHGR